MIDVLDRRSETASRQPERRDRPARPMRAVSAQRSSDVALNAGEAIDGAVEQTDVMLPADLLHDDEVVILFLRPSPLFIVLGSLGSLAFIAILTMFLAYLAKTVVWVGWTDAQAFTFGFGLVLIRLAWQGVDWWSRVYVLTDRRVIRKMGVVRVAVFETSLCNVQHTGVSMRVRERLFGLGTIGFATAGTGYYEAYWVMLSRPFAVHKIVVEAINRYGRRRNSRP